MHCLHPKAQCSVRGLFSNRLFAVLFGLKWFSLSSLKRNALLKAMLRCHLLLPSRSNMGCVKTEQLCSKNEEGRRKKSSCFCGAELKLLEMALGQSGSVRNGTQVTFKLKGGGIWRGKNTNVTSGDAHFSTLQE